LSTVEKELTELKKWIEVTRKLRGLGKKKTDRQIRKQIGRFKDTEN